MNKHIGIAKQQWRSIEGIHAQIVTYCSEDETKIKEWFKKFPPSREEYQCELLILNDITEEMEKFFSIFQDSSAEYTKAEIQNSQKVF